VEIIIELLLQVVAEVLFEGVFEALGWLLRRRWGRLVSGVLLGFGGGLVWSAVVGHAGAPVVGSIVIVAQAAAIPVLAGRPLLGRQLRRDVLVDLALIGAAVVAGRWMGWLVQ
jgi:hypothetical protein